MVVVVRGGIFEGSGLKRGIDGNQRGSPSFLWDAIEVRKQPNFLKVIEEMKEGKQWKSAVWVFLAK